MPSVAMLPGKTPAGGVQMTTRGKATDGGKGQQDFGAKGKKKKKKKNKTNANKNGGSVLTSLLQGGRWWWWRGGKQRSEPDHKQQQLPNAKELAS